MVRLVWGESDKRLYETGIDRGVIYPLDGGLGVPWSGLVAVSEAPSGSDINESHLDGDKIRQQRRSDSFSATVTAYSYPRELESHMGTERITAQRRTTFGMSYRTKVVSDTDKESYLIHLVYNASVSPITQSFSSLNDGVDVNAFQWDLQTVPEIFPDGEASAHLVINPNVAYPWVVSALEDILYGSDTTFARLPGVNELIDMFENASILRIFDNGDGTWTADGPDEAFLIMGDYFEITWPSAIWIDTNTYRISSL